MPGASPIHRPSPPGARRPLVALLLALGSLAGVGAVLAMAGGRLPASAEVLEPLPGVESRRAAEGDTIVVGTWNLHYGAGASVDVGRAPSRAFVEQNLEAVAEQILSWDADIVALQEVDRGADRSFGIDQLDWLRRRIGLPHAAWTETWNARWVPFPGIDPRRHIGRVVSGQAVLSRFPLTEAIRHALPQPAGNHPLYNAFYLHRALLDVVADLCAGRRLRIINAHLEAYDPMNKVEQAAMTAGLLGDAGPDLLLLGDMNSVPTRAATRAGWPDEPDTDMSADDTIARLAGIDGLEEIVPEPKYLADEAPWFTFPATAPNRRLDYLFFGRGLQRVLARVPRLSPPSSDHLPIVATLRLAP